jgi:hypothetical protein
MTRVWIVLLLLLTTMVGSELMLRGTKIHTGLGRVLVVWAGVFLAGIWPVFRYGDTGLVIFTLFWSGAFLSWFGVRSHIENSILLRMLYLLRGKPLAEADVLAKYRSHYGEAMRVEELLRGGLTVKVGDVTSVAPKGKIILRIVALLR